MKYLITASLAALLAACGASDATPDTEPAQAIDQVANPVDGVKTEAAATAQVLDASQDISTAPAGTYVDEDGHAYIAFSYLHQGYSKPILRWSDFDATLELDPVDPTASTLEVSIDPASIDSGVDVFDEHLVGEDFFDVANHPDITFTSTDLQMDSPTTGTLTGDLTMKGITKPLSLDVTLNKIGKNFRSGVDMFGVSGTGQLMRSDWDLGKYAPSVGDEVDLMIEIEFQKAP